MMVWNRFWKNTFFFPFFPPNLTEIWSQMRMRVVLVPLALIFWKQFFFYFCFQYSEPYFHTSRHRVLKRVDENPLACLRFKKCVSRCSLMFYNKKRCFIFLNKNFLTILTLIQFFRRRMRFQNGRCPKKIDITWLTNDRIFKRFCRIFISVMSCWLNSFPRDIM